jgi:hypothetical protein
MIYVTTLSYYVTILPAITHTSSDKQIGLRSLSSLNQHDRNPDYKIVDCEISKPLRCRPLEPKQVLGLLGRNKHCFFSLLSHSSFL